jgi:hypothetical protein
MLGGPAEGVAVEAGPAAALVFGLAMIRSFF